MEEEFLGFFDEEQQQRLFRKFEKMNRNGRVRFLDVEEFEELINAFLDTGDLVKAEQALNAALKQHPASGSLKFLQADVYVRKNQHESAQDILISLERIEPENPEVNYLLGVVKLNLFQFEGAFEYMAKAIRFDRDGELEIALRAGKQLAEYHCYPQALSCYEKALGLYPQDTEVMYELYASWESLGNFKKSGQWMQHFLNEDPFSAEMWYVAAFGSFRSHRYEDALEAIDFALALLPDQINFLFMRAAILGRLHRMDEAKKWFKALVPDQLDVYMMRLMLSVGFVEAGDAKAALRYFPSEMHIKDNYRDMMDLCSARIYVKLGRDDIASGIFETAIDRRTHEEILLIDAYRFFTLRHRYVEALDILNLLIEADPFRIRYRKHLLTIIEKLKPESEIYLAYRQAIRDMPGVADFHYHYGTFLLQHGEERKGMRYFRNGLVLDPGRYAYYLQENVVLRSHPGLLTLIEHHKNKTHEF